MSPPSNRPGATRAIRRSLLAATVAAALLAGCTGAPASGGRAVRTPTGSGSPSGSGTSAIDWTACGALRCGTLRVPLDGSAPAGATVELALVEQPAGDPDHRIGTLLVNPGGPGASGTDFVRAGFGTGVLRDRFDVIGWDPRGVGGSRPTTCPDERLGDLGLLDPGPDDAGEQSRLDDAARAVAEGCGRQSASLLAHMDTITAAADVERIRDALGEDQLSFVLFSYGTAIGEQYAARYPSRVRAMVLDGVVDPTQDLEATLTDQTAALQRSVDRSFAACRDDADCPVRDPAGVLAHVAAPVEGDPLRNDHGPPVGPADVSLAVIQSSYTTEDGRGLLQALADADGGDGTGIATLAARYSSGADEASYLAVSCTDSPHPDQEGFHQLADRLAAISPIAGRAVANELLPCAWWPAPVTGTTVPVHAEGSGPIVLVGNTGDAATPAANAEHVGRALEQGHLVTYTGAGHTSYDQSGCVRDAADALLVELTTPRDGLVCTS